MTTNNGTSAIPLDEARDMVMTASLIIERLDGKRPTEADRRTACDDALDLAFWIAGSTTHLDREMMEARARAIANA